MAGGPYNIPRNTKGEGKILMIFSPKAFIFTVIFAAIALATFYPICVMLGHNLIGWGFVIFFGLIGFVITTFKIPNSNNFELTRKAGGESILEIITRYLKFKRKKNKIYLYFTKEDENE